MIRSFIFSYLRFCYKSSTRDQMNEYPSPFPRKDGPQEASRNCTPVRNHRQAMEHDAGDLVECTGKSCQSCTAGLIADCVAVCCCPCAVVNILAFALFKVPWTVGKRILKLGKKKKRKCERGCLECPMDLDGISRKERAGQGTSEFVLSSFGDEELKDNFSAGFEEEEELWFEFHLGFGRVSFTGIPSLCKGN